MNRLILSAGVMLLLVPQTGAAQSFYGIIDRIAANASMFDGVEKDVEDYVPLSLKGRLLFDIKPTDVDLAVTENKNSICTVNDISVTSCISTLDIRRQAEVAVWHRTLGRELQLITTSYEHKTAGYTGQGGALNVGLPGILNIWQSGVDEMTNPVSLSSIDSGEYADIDSAQSIADDLENLLNAPPYVDTESLQGLAAAVRRYRHGYKYVQDRDGSCNDDADDNDLQLLTYRWCDVEDLLEDLHNEIDTSVTYEPGALVFFQPFALKSVNVMAWVRVDDAGLAWSFPMEPVLPTLIPIQDDSIPMLGGEYPDEIPQPGPLEGICSHPVGQRGYLCRPVESSECPMVGTGSVTPIFNDDFTITLTECLPYNIDYETPIHRTASGPDICSTGGWKQPLTAGYFEDGDDQDLQCQTCLPEVKDEDGYDPNGKCYTGYYSSSGGTISVCPDSTSDIPDNYKLMKELVVAQQLCARPEKDRDILETMTESASCCELQWYPSLIACKAMADDGKFDELDLDVTQCAAALTQDACAKNAIRLANNRGLSGLSYFQFLGNAGICLQNPDEYFPVDQIEDAAKQGTALSVADDQRITSIEASFDRSCDPNCKAQYENTIGNNLCYIGQCIERAVEETRLIPGRMPLTANDPAFPWDGCAEPDPLNGLYIEMPPAYSSFRPEYRGLELIRSIDIAICQANGYPALTPPVLCAFSPQRQLSLPSVDLNIFAQGFNRQATEQAQQSNQVQQAAQVVGTRVAIEQYEQYIDRSVQAFGNLINIAATLVEQIGDTSFPSVMCPRYVPDNGCFYFRR